MKYFNLALAATVLVISSSADAALSSRLGGLAYYDNVTNLTWMADVNYAQANGDHATGNMNWLEANTWAENLTVDGVSGWRLAAADDTCILFGCTNGEIGDFFYNVLGGVDGDGFSFSGNANYALFSNISAYTWTSTELNSTEALAFDLFDGFAGIQANLDKNFVGSQTGSFNVYAWAVHSGDVAAVPVPAAVWLFASGLIGLAGIARRKKT